MINKKRFHEIAEEIEREWDVGGLADGVENGFYERFAFEVCKRYIQRFMEAAINNVLEIRFIDEQD